MKFVCGKCNAKYNLADERVAGKVLKIRCKTCGHIIEVSGPQPAAPRAADRARKAVADPGLADRFAESFSPHADGHAKRTPGLLQAVKRSAAQLEKDETQVATWFVAMDDKPVGPITARSVWRFQTSGKVTDDSLVWKEGMPDWVALRNCKDLVGLLAKLELAESVARAEARPKPGEGAPQAPRAGLLAGPEAGAVPASSPLRGQRLGRIDEDSASPPEPAAALAPAVLDEILSDMAPGERARPASVEQEFFGGADDGGEEESRIASLQQISLPRVTGQNRWITLAAVGFLGVAIAVLGVAVATSGSTETRVITEVVEKVIEKEKIVYRDKPQVRTEAGKEANDESGKKASSTKGKSGQAAASGTGSKDAETMDEKKKKLLEQMGLSAPSGDQKLVGGSDKTSGSDKGSGSSALTGDQIRKTYNSNKNSMQICYERSLKQGEVPEDASVKADTRILVGGSGMVKTVTVTGQAAKYPTLKSCIEKAVKKWAFPASAGDSPVEIPTLFTPK
ncbi:MAG TPA: AgmX/PglI C-terminal domain-containing protein [Polyangia bacterium]|nr:AgmX/PglI C-terminal domain-containing protein [Polyangia bacterium]